MYKIFQNYYHYFSSTILCKARLFFEVWKYENVMKYIAWRIVLNNNSGNTRFVIYIYIYIYK